MPMYNNFPQTYQPYIPQMPAQPANNGIIWVQGEAGAKSYLVAPNTTVQLWDSENQIIYLKSADASGMPNMKVLDYTVRGATIPTETVSDAEGKFILRKDFDGLKEEIDDLKDEIAKLKRRKEKDNG